MEHFWSGFEKRAMEPEHAAAALGAASVLGLGALSGHATHVGKKLTYARQGKDYEPKSFVDKNPKLTGAISLGYAPLVSHALHQRALDRDNPKVREILKQHPHVTAGM